MPTPNASSSQGPLTGLSVVEMAGLGPCPLAGQLLADLGARVVVIDRVSKSRDVTDVNRRGKQSIALNLKSAEGADIAAKLIDGADVLLEGFRPGVMERLGLGPESCCERNPRLIYARVTGWGQTGPLSQTAGHDINYLALTGALAGIGTQNGGPIPPMNLVADYAGGTLFMVFGVMSALYERQHSGRGQVIDAAMCDGVSAMMGLIHQWFAQGSWTTQRESNLLDGAAPFYRCYETSDGKHMSVGALEPNFYKILINLLDLPEALCAEQNNQEMWASHIALFTDVFRKRTQAEWVAHFDGTDACVAPVLTLDEVNDHPHNQQRRIFQSVDDVLQASPAPRFSRSEAGTVNTMVGAGHSSVELLDELGFSKEEQEILLKEGVLT